MRAPTSGPPASRRVSTGLLYNVTRPTHSNGELQEIPFTELGIARRRRDRVLQSAEQLTRTKHLASPRAFPPRVCGGEVEQLQRARHRIRGAFGLASPERTNRSAYFAAHVGQLLDQRQRMPTASRKFAVRD